MFRFITIVIALGVAVYKAVYGGQKPETPQPQTTNQPIAKKPTPAPLSREKPVVIFGEPLTDEEWEMLKTAPETLN